MSLPGNDLKQWLSLADEVYCQPAAVPDLAGRVRRLAQTRRQRKMMVAAAAVLIFAGFSVFLMISRVNRPISGQNEQKFAQKSPGNPGSLVPGTQNLEPVSAACLEAMIATREYVVEQLRAAEARRQKLSQLEEKLAAIPDARQEIEKEVEQAALINLYYADSLREENRDDLALACYRETIELYPRTWGAELARQKLKKFQL